MNLVFSKSISISSLPFIRAHAAKERAAQRDRRCKKLAQGDEMNTPVDDISPPLQTHYWSRHSHLTDQAMPPRALALTITNAASFYVSTVWQRAPHWKSLRAALLINAVLCSFHIAKCESFQLMNRENVFLLGCFSTNITCTYSLMRFCLLCQYVSRIYSLLKFLPLTAQFFLNYSVHQFLMLLAAHRGKPTDVGNLQYWCVTLL